MNVAKLLEIGGDMLKIMSISGLKINDWQYKDLYSDYEYMRKQGMKYWFAIEKLSHKYNISQSSICRIIKRLSRSVNV